MAGHRVRHHTSKPAVLSLAGRFELNVANAAVPVDGNAQRLLAYLAISGGATRTTVAGELWGNKSQDRAAANLRMTLWRLPQVCDEFVERRGSNLNLSDSLRVDVAEIEACARAMLIARADLEAAYRLVPECPLLPGWGDYWVAVERERLHLLRLEALDVAARACLDAHDPARALEFALSAVRAEPLRESTWRLVVTAHRAQGNLADVRRAYADYCELMDRELSLPPSPLMRRLMADIGADVLAGCHPSIVTHR